MEICEAPHTKQHKVNSGYHGVSQRLWLAICSIVAPPNVEVLIWNICQNALPTNEYLFERKLVNSPLCPICGTEPETVEHVFLFCPLTRPLWFGSDFQWCIDVNTVQSFQLWLFQKTSTMYLLCWEIFFGLFGKEEMNLFLKANMSIL
ncbi:hypothetical protein VNO77_04404 [Canavalia gladiata]|uniref:Reverse transcriptase zinc-binding domain-containing protein n=1 Tax=Canavalia gladiata TaxID=3824 RepID=A0AAN9MWI2_CANGL